MMDRLVRPVAQSDRFGTFSDKSVVPSSSCRQDASRVRHRACGSVQAQNESREPALLPGDLSGKWSFVLNRLSSEARHRRRPLAFNMSFTTALEKQRLNFTKGLT
jgi:hypothetical protein